MLVENSLRGIDSHGVVAHLASYAKDALSGAIDLAATPAVLSRNGATAVVDGRHALGLHTARIALDTAMDLAAEFGVGSVVARNVAYLCGMWWCVEPALERGQIALVAMNSEACVAPHGGRAAFHGTNPIAVAIPNGDSPLILDMRTNGLRMADYYTSIARGTPLPTGGLLASDGRPSTDPGDLAAGGTTTPLAGSKGWGLSLVIDVLAPILADGPITHSVPTLGGGAPAAYSCFFLAIDPSFFLPADRFHQLITQLVCEAHAAPPLDPDQPVRIPGDRALAERERRLKHGIPIDPEMWRLLLKKLDELGIDLSEPALV